MLFIMVVLFVPAIAQKGKGTISGTVAEAGGKPVAAATVSLLQAANGTLVKTALSAADGSFEFASLPNGNYKIQVSASGFENAVVADLVLTDEKNALAAAVPALQPKVKGMEAVTVTAKKPFIEAKADRTIVNVDASPTNAGATALEVLEKSPGISVNNDGIISLRGKSGVLVMMDGKQTFMSPADLANLLKNMPASSIDQIEIMTNPSARFDAAGNSGIINIKTKKGKTAGFNGSIMVGITTSFFESAGNFYVIPKSQNSINFNYRKNKFNFFGNYNPNMFRGRSELRINRTIIDQNKNILGYRDVETQFKFGNDNHSLKLGMDYYADKKNTFGVVVNGFAFAGHPTPQTTTTTYDEHYQPLNTMVSQTNNRIKLRNFSANFNYRHQFDSAGRELTADVDYIVYDNTSRMTLGTDFYDGTGQPVGSPLELRGVLPASISIWTAKSDYVHPLSKKAKIEAGVKSSWVKNNNEVNYERQSGNAWLPDARSNHFIYDENINAAYLNASGQWGKWSLQGGLRLENTNAKGYQVTNDSTFTRHFTNLFPSVFITYELNKNNSLTGSYSRRITRPNYQDLNPFIYFLDSLSYRKGNPFLLPQFTHNFELSHSFKNKLITTINYNSTSDVISQLIKPDGDLLYLSSENVARFRNMGVSVTAPVPVRKWWMSNIFINVFNNHYEGIYESRPLDLSYTSFLVNVTQTFTVKQGFTLEVSGFYRARGVNQLNIDEPMYAINFGAQKQVMKGKGTLRLNLRDPFWLQRYKGHTEYDIVDSRIANKWDNRQVTASFTWRFGKNTPGASNRRRAAGSQDEQNRVGGAGQ